MGWKETDDKLIRRGELILDLKSLKNHRKELKTMNKGKRGPHYRLANTYIQLLAAVRYLYQMPYRQLEGFTRTLHGLVPALPQGDYSGLRPVHGAPAHNALHDINNMRERTLYTRLNFIYLSRLKIIIIVVVEKYD